MVDACGLPAGHPLRFCWIFYGGLTNAETEVRAVHTPRGRVDIWRNPAGPSDRRGADQRFPLSLAGRPFPSPASPAPYPGSGLW